jgi:hypothetical protein
MKEEVVFAMRRYSWDIIHIYRYGRLWLKDLNAGMG